MEDCGLYQFVYTDTFSGTDKRIEFSTRAETITEIGEAFSDFLMACGFCACTIEKILPNFEE